METRIPSLSRLIPLALVVLLGVVLALAVWRSFGGTTPLAAHGYRVTIPMPQASNLNAAADVRSAGVTIGEVVAVRRVRSVARVTVELQRRFAPLHVDARARLRSKTLLGEAYLELGLGSKGSAVVPEGGSLHAGQVDRTTQLDDVLQFMAPRTRRNLRRSFRGLAKALDGRAPALNGALGRLTPVTADFRTVADALDRQRDELRVLLRAAGTTFDALGARDGALSGAIRSADQVFWTTAARDRALAATVRELPPFLRELRTASRELGATSDELGAAVSALRPAADELGPALSSIARNAPEFATLFHRLPGVLTAGTRALPALDSVLRSAGPAFREVYPTTRELIPVLQLLAVIRNSLVSTFANVAQVHGGVAVGPGNQVVNYAIGVIQLWNETIGGWVKRLPSHRGNPYPAPGFLDDLAAGLESYDCRHVHNRAYLPPFGGAAPCHAQSPWTFRGETASFPHLQVAAP
jgi:phospholipid/cholesterol/gamma-HCH transport system substrate-binding protein